MLAEFRFTKECEQALRTSLTEVRDRVTRDKETRIQRQHTSVVNWKDTDADKRHRAEIRTVVTNPAGTEKVKVTLDVTIPKTAVPETYHGSRHTLSDAGYSQVEGDITDVVADVLDGCIGPVGSPRLLSAGATVNGELSYYEDLEVRF